MSPDALVRFGGIPALTYCCRTGVAPVRARSKSLAARERAAGGRDDGSVDWDWDCGCIWASDWEVFSGGLMAADAADWP